MPAAWKFSVKMDFTCVEQMEPANNPVQRAEPLNRHVSRQK